MDKLCDFCHCFFSLMENRIFYKGKTVHGKCYITLRRHESENRRRTRETNMLALQHVDEHR
jgi:hypothetical protein